MKNLHSKILTMNCHFHWIKRGEEVHIEKVFVMDFSFISCNYCINND